MDRPNPPEEDTAPEDLPRLIERVAVSGDRQAFALLFHHFAPKVKSYLRRMGVADQAADDLCQEVMLTVWRRAGQYDRRLASPATWIFTIARNRRIDLLRRDRKTETGLDDTILEAPDGAPLSDEIVAARQMRERILGAVAALPPEQARLLRIFYFEEKSHSAIAEEMALPLGTVKSRLRLALGKMRTLIAGDSQDGEP